MPTEDVNEPVLHAPRRPSLPPGGPWQGFVWTGSRQIEVDNFPGTQCECHKTCRQDAKGSSMVGLRFQSEGRQDILHGGIALGASDEIPHGGGVETLVSVAHTSIERRNKALVD